MSDIDKPLPNDTPNVTLTIRMIMSGKEVGSIIGKGGEIINSIREESGAKIHISDGSVPERIVTVTGSTDAILKSFNLIVKKFEEDGPEKNGNIFKREHRASSFFNCCCCHFCCQIWLLRKKPREFVNCFESSY